MLNETEMNLTPVGIWDARYKAFRGYALRIQIRLDL